MRKPELKLKRYKPPLSLQEKRIWSLVVAKTRGEKVSEFNLSSCSPFALMTYSKAIDKLTLKCETKSTYYAETMGIVSDQLLIIDLDDHKELPTALQALITKYPTHHHLSKSGQGWKIYYHIDRPMTKKIRIFRESGNPAPAKKLGELFCGAFVTSTDPDLSDFSNEHVAAITQEQLSEFVPEIIKQKPNQKITAQQQQAQTLSPQTTHIDLDKVLNEVKRMLAIIPVDLDPLLEIAYETKLMDFDANSYTHWLLVSHALADLALQLASEYPTASGKLQVFFNEWSAKGSSYKSEEDCNERFERSIEETRSTDNPIVSFSTLRKLFWSYRIPISDFPGISITGKDKAKTVDPTDPQNYRFLTEFLKIKVCQEISHGHFYIKGPQAVIKNYFLNKQFHFLTSQTGTLSLPFHKLKSDDLTYRLVSAFRQMGIKGVLRGHPVLAGLQDIGVEPIDTLYEWVTAKPWDQKPRVLDLIEESITLDSTVVPPGTPNSFFYLLIMKHLIHMAGLRAKAYRVYANKQIPSDRFKKAQGILILAGYQNTRKSTWIECLLPSQASYVKNVTPSSVKDTLEMQRALAGTFVLNIDEIDAVLDNINISDFKNVITQDRDSFRTMYSQSFKDHPRAAGFFGTTNKSHLKLDRTGNRRFWVIPVTQCDAEPFNQCDYQQVWAELLHYAENLGVEEWNVTGQEKEYIDKTARYYTKQTTGGKTLDMIFTDEEGKSLVFDHEEFDFDILFNKFPQRLQRLFAKEKLLYPTRGNKLFVHLSNKHIMDDTIDLKLSSFNHEISGFLDNLLGFQNKSKGYDKLIYKEGVISYRTGKPTPTDYHFIPYKEPLLKLIDQGHVPPECIIFEEEPSE